MDDASIRNIVSPIARNHLRSVDDSPDRAAPKGLLRRVAIRLQDRDDPIVERLSGIGDLLRFQLALAEFIVDTARDMTGPAAGPTRVSSAAEEIAKVLFASRLDEEVLDRVARIKTSAEGYLSAKR